MTTIKKSFSLEGEIPRLEEEIEQLEEEVEEIEDEADQINQRHENPDIDFDKDDSEAYTRIKKEWKNLKAEISVKEDKIERFGEYVDQWESTEFRVRELTFGETQELKDVVSSESFDVDVELQEVEGTPLQGLYESEFLKKAVIEQPDDAPEDPNNLPEILGDWLLDKCESINSVGDTDVGNMSLEDEIN